MKTRESFLLQGYDFQWFLYAQLSGRFKCDKMLSIFDQSTTVFEIELCINGQHVIAKMYKLLLKFKMEEE